MVRSPHASERARSTPSPHVPPLAHQASPDRLAFRPAARSRARIAVGIGLLAVAVVVNLAVYRSIDDRRNVLQVVRDVPAGQRIEPGDLRPVKVGGSSDVRMLSAESATAIVGHYAKVRLIAGSLVVAEALQSSPLVAPGAAHLAITVPVGELPTGLRERSLVQLVLLTDAEARAGSGPAPAGTITAAARVVGLPSSVDSSTGTVALTVELAQQDAAAVATATAVRVVLLDPGHDPASTPGGTT